MGFRSWLRERFSRESRARETSHAQERTAAQPVEVAPGCPADAWEEVPAYLPVDPAEHMPACIIASTITAGDQDTSKLVVKRVSIANPEHRRVTAIATALGAGALEKSSFSVKRIYRKKEEKGTERNYAA